MKQSLLAALSVWTVALLLAAMFNTSTSYLPVPHAEKAWSLYWTAVAMGSLLAGIFMHEERGQ